MDTTALHDADSGEAEAPELTVLEVSRVHAYEHNPRRGRNPEYDRIKASIRADGLGQPLVVTQRPGEVDYIVHAGGNTRLKILTELFEESGDRRFATVPCVIRPWRGEADVMLAHLRENDLRGELTFLDKALAISRVEQFVQEEVGEIPTQARLAEILQQCGYGLSQGLLSQMAYAVERLKPLLPQALASGIGRPQVARIRALDRAARAIWLELGVDAEAEYDQVFETLCRRYDAADWDIANLRRALEAEIAERAEISIHSVSLDIDARVAGRQSSLPTMPTTAEVGEPGHERDQRKRTSAAPGSACTPAVSEAVDTPPSNRAGDNVAAPSASARPAPESPASDHGDATPVVAPNTPTRTDLKSLRARLWTLASRLAQRNGLSELVQPLSGQGLGFVLQDVPDPALVDQLDEDALAQVSMVWWYLAACAELTVAPLDALLPALPEGSVLRRALVDQDAGLLFASVWTLDPGHMGYRLWHRLDDRDWQDLLSLMDTYRTLRQSAAADDKAVWGSR